MRKRTPATQTMRRRTTERRVRDIRRRLMAGLPLTSPMHAFAARIFAVQGVAKIFEPTKRRSIFEPRPGAPDAFAKRLIDGTPAKRGPVSGDVFAAMERNRTRAKQEAKS